MLAGDACNAGPQACGGDPTSCGSGVFYDVLVCDDEDDSGVWHWRPIVSTVCADAGASADAPSSAEAGDGVADASVPVLDASGPFFGTSGPLLDTSTPVHDMGACVPWSSVRGQPFVADADAGASPASLMADIARMEGSWIGHATSPFGEWDVVLTFQADGHYTAVAYDGQTSIGTPPPFYYGATQGCESLQGWKLLEVALGYGASGPLDVPFAYGGTGCAFPAWQGELQGVFFDAAGDRLQFVFTRNDEYEPIAYDLWRLC